eukprot:scaffold1266_cov134-Pinguiococcus_pyrenoidosus.AAC.5
MLPPLDQKQPYSAQSSTSNARFSRRSCSCQLRKRAVMLASIPRNLSALGDKIGERLGAYLARRGQWCGR